MSTPHSEIQNLAASALVELFVLDATPCGGGTYYFHAGTNQLGTSVVWQGQAYLPFPVAAEGFEWNSKGTLPRPKLRVSALDGLVGGLVRDLEDLVGAKVTLKRTFAKYLDAVNFPGAYNPTADPTACYPDEPWVVERKTLENDEVIEFELASPMDVQNAMIPKRRITANVCPWIYKGAECGYAGTLPTCAHTLADCIAHFGVTTGSASLGATTGTNVYTRATGSFIADGFSVGMTISAHGFSTLANNGTAVVTSVTEGTLGVNRTLTTEAQAAGKTVISDRALPFGAFPGTARIR